MINLSPFLLDYCSLIVSLVHFFSYPPQSQTLFSNSFGECPWPKGPSTDHSRYWKLISSLWYSPESKMNYSIQAICLNVNRLFILYTVFRKKVFTIFETVTYKWKYDSLFFRIMVKERDWLICRRSQASSLLFRARSWRPRSWINPLDASSFCYET